jgi:hypothetical protein
LLDLLAVKFVVVDAALDTIGDSDPTLTRIDTQDTLHVYENRQALPRASFIPEIAVVEDSRELLSRLMTSGFPARGYGLVQETPGDGFYGAPGSFGTVDWVSDESESLQLRAFSTAGGFVFLSDQFYPGWEASVNGHPVPILKANFAFRAVRIPAGESQVEFQYRPRSLLVGAALSTVTVMALSIGVLLERRRRSLA